MKIAIIGYGSIGQRHERNCLAQGHSVEVVSNHARIKLKSQRYDLVIVCSKTSEHLEDLKKFKTFSESFLIEKPLAANSRQAQQIRKLMRRKKVRVGYCLIFNPIIKKVKDLIEKDIIGDVYFGQIYAASYLPDWRKGEDYKTRYSANKNEGGGVALDLIHEINYARYLFPDKLIHIDAYQEKISNLEITSNDFAHFVLRSKSRFLTITLSYFQKSRERYIKLVGQKGVLFADLVNNQIVITGTNSKNIFSQKFEHDSNQMYIDEINSMVKFIKGKEQQHEMLGIDQAIKDLRIIEGNI